MHFDIYNLNRAAMSQYSLLKGSTFLDIYAYLKNLSGDGEFRCFYEVTFTILLNFTTIVKIYCFVKLISHHLQQKRQS